VGPSNTGGPAQVGLKKFFDMMPNLKASDFDYIIFDMPPLGQTSPTWGMASFMDKLLVVVEAEKNNRDLVKRGYGKLVAERNNVSVIVNKTRSYVPKWLDFES
jgi:Mrp family chromosome partitioning ATPase